MEKEDSEGNWLNLALPGK